MGAVFNRDQLGFRYAANRGYNPLPHAINRGLKLIGMVFHTSVQGYVCLQAVTNLAAPFWTTGSQCPHLLFSTAFFVLFRHRLFPGRSHQVIMDFIKIRLTKCLKTNKFASSCVSGWNHGWMMDWITLNLQEFSKSYIIIFLYPDSPNWNAGIKINSEY